MELGKIAGKIPEKCREIRNAVLKSKRATAGLIAVIVILGGALFLYSSDWFMFDFLDRVNEATINHRIVGNARHALLKFGDEINIFRVAGRSSVEGVDEYRLWLSANDLKYFSEASIKNIEAGYSVESWNYRTVKLEHDGKEYAVGMALFGDRPNHFIGTKKSFKIKTPKEEFIENKRRLRFILPEDRDFFSPLFAEHLGKKLGLFMPQYEIAEVKLNGISQGLYLVEEGIDQYYPERHKQPGMLLIEYGENWIEDHPVMNAAAAEWGIAPPGGYDYSAGVLYGTGHNTPFDLDISNIDEIDSLHADQIAFKLRQLFSAVKANDQSKVEGLFDLENVSSVEALRAITGNTHDFTGDDLRLFYDTTTGKFGFVPRVESGISPLGVYLGGIDNYLSTYARRPVPVLRYVLRNSKLRHLRNEKIYEILQQKGELLSYFNELDEKYRQAFVNDGTNVWSSREINHLIGKQRQYLQSNFQTLEKQFEYSKAYINAIGEGNSLLIEVIPDSVTALEFNSLSVEFEARQRTGEAIVKVFDEKGGLVAEETVDIAGNRVELEGQANRNIIQADLGEEMEPIRTVFTLQVLFQDEVEVKAINVEMQNAVTGKEIPSNDIYLKLAVADAEYSELQYLGEEEFLQMHPELEFEKQGKELHLVEGEYTIERDVVIPANLQVVFEAGANIKIGEGKSIVSYSSLDVRGTEEKPVVISQLEEGRGC